LTLRYSLLLCVWVDPLAEHRSVTGTQNGKMGFDLYTILPSPILYGVWHNKEGSVGGRILRNSRVIVMQQGRLCRWGGGNKRMIDSRNKALK